MRKKTVSGGGETGEAVRLPKIFFAYSRFTARLRRHYRELYLEAFEGILEKIES